MVVSIGLVKLTDKRINNVSIKLGKLIDKCYYNTIKKLINVSNRLGKLIDKT